MENDTYLAQQILASEDVRADQSCKKILSAKAVLAYIMKETLPEYTDCTLAEVEQLIEPETITGHSEVAPGMTNKKEVITGLSTESVILNEKHVFFDVRFQAALPDRVKTKQQYCLYLDVEAQKEYRPGYPIEKRAAYYLARLLSAQIEQVHNNTDYGQLQKVCSIWICLGNSIPEKEQMTISEFSMNKKDIVGKTKDEKSVYDLFEYYLIRLGKGSTEHNALGMLQTLFWSDLEPEERILRLQKQYHLAIPKEVEKEVTTMCTYSQAVFEKGESEGVQKGKQEGLIEGERIGVITSLVGLINRGLLTEEVAAEQAETSVDEFWNLAAKFNLKK